MDTEALVYVDINGAQHLAGRLWARIRKGRDSATFEYDKEWLANPIRFSLEPTLQLGPGPFHTPIHKVVIGLTLPAQPTKPAVARRTGEKRVIEELDRQQSRELTTELRRLVE